MDSSLSSRQLPDHLDTLNRDWPAAETNVKCKVLLEANSKQHDIVIYTDGSVPRDRSGLGSPSSRVEGLYTKTVAPTWS